MALSEIDRNLLERCLSQKPKAWEDFVDRYMGLVLHVINHSAQCRSLRLTNEDREDLASEVFLGIIRDDFAVLRHFRGDSSLATYLTVVTRRIVVVQLLKRKSPASLAEVAQQSNGGTHNGNGSGIHAAHQNGGHAGSGQASGLSGIGNSAIHRGGVVLGSGSAVGSSTAAGNVRGGVEYASGIHSQGSGIHSETNFAQNSVAIDRVDNADEIARLLGELEGTEAEIVRLYHLEGKSYQEISSAVGMPENSIGPTLSRARQKMRRVAAE